MDRTSLDAVQQQVSHESATEASIVIVPLLHVLPDRAPGDRPGPEPREALYDEAVVPLAGARGVGDDLGAVPQRSAYRNTIRAFSHPRGGFLGTPVRLERGQVLEGVLFNEPMRVESVDSENSGVWTLGLVGLRTEHFQRVRINAEQLSMLTIRPAAPTYAGDGALVRLGLQAYALGIAYEFDPYFGLSVSKVDPLPHQLEAVYEHMLKLPTVRFLLADDAGAGKTIMAGLLLRELKLRGLVDRTLVVCPANLTFQWQRELREELWGFPDHLNPNRLASAQAIKKGDILIFIGPWEKRMGETGIRGGRVSYDQFLRGVLGSVTAFPVTKSYFPNDRIVWPPRGDERWRHRVEIDPDPVFQGKDIPVGKPVLGPDLPDILRRVMVGRSDPLEIPEHLVLSLLSAIGRARA